MYIINVYDPRFFDIWYAGMKKGAKTLKQWAEDEKADMVFNLAFFNMATSSAIKQGIAYDTIYMVKAKGEQIGDYISYTPDVKINEDNICSGWRTAIMDGKVFATDKSTARSRNMHGFTEDGRYIHVQTTKGYTEVQVANEVNSYIPKHYGTKVKFLAIQDAGGSTGSYSGKSKLAFAPEGSRAVPTVVCIRNKCARVGTNVIRYGSNSDDVKLLQQTLGGIKIDGSYGPNTRSRVKAAQSALHLTPDGSAGPITLKALGLL